MQYLYTHMLLLQWSAFHIQGVVVTHLEQPVFLLGLPFYIYENTKHILIILYFNGKLTFFEVLFKSFLLDKFTGALLKWLKANKNKKN